MAELLEIIANAVSLADVGLRLGTKFYTFGVAVADADEAIIAISKDVTLTSSVLKEISHVLGKERTKTGIVTNGALHQTDELLTVCDEVFQRIHNILPEKAPNVSPGTDKLSKSERLRWISVQPRVEALRNDLERLKSSLLLLLNVLIYARLIKDNASQQTLAKTDAFVNCLSQQQDGQIVVSGMIKTPRSSLTASVGAPGPISFLTPPTTSEDTIRQTSLRRRSRGTCKSIPSLLAWYDDQDETVASDYPSQEQSKGDVLHNLISHHTRLFSNLFEEIRSRSYEIPGASRTRIEKQIDIAQSNELDLLDVTIDSSRHKVSITLPAKFASQTHNLQKSVRQSTSPRARRHKKSIRSLDEPNITTTVRTPEGIGLSDPSIDVDPSPKARKIPNQGPQPYQTDSEDWEERPVEEIESQQNRLARYTSKSRSDHTTTPPVYSCSYPSCNYTTCSFYDLMHHANVHSQADTFPCPYGWCVRADGERPFSREDHLDKHMQKMHMSIWKKREGEWENLVQPNNEESTTRHRRDQVEDDNYHDVEDYGDDQYFAYAPPQSPRTSRARNPPDPGLVEAARWYIRDPRDARHPRSAGDPRGQSHDSRTEMTMYPRHYPVTSAGAGHVVTNGINARYDYETAPPSQSPRAYPRAYPEAFPAQERTASSRYARISPDIDIRDPYSPRPRGSHYPLPKLTATDPHQIPTNPYLASNPYRPYASSSSRYSQAPGEKDSYSASHGIGYPQPAYPPATIIQQQGSSYAPAPAYPTSPYPASPIYHNDSQPSMYYLESPLRKRRRLETHELRPTSVPNGSIFNGGARSDGYAAPTYPPRVSSTMGDVAISGSVEGNDRSGPRRAHVLGEDDGVKKLLSMWTTVKRPDLDDLRCERPMKG